jgi:hypothetical protein
MTVQTNSAIILVSGYSERTKYMSTTDELIQQAITQGKAGNKPEAIKILAQVVKQEPTNARAWYLLSQVVETKEQIEYCLNKVLEIDPINQQAINRLNSIRATPPTTTAESQEPLPLTQPKQVARKQSKAELLKVGLLVFIAVCCIGVALITQSVLKVSKLRPISDISYETIVDNNRRMTSAQWEAYQKSILGKRVQWQGWITDIGKDSSGTNYIRVDLHQYGLSDVNLKYPEKESLKYSKKDFITFQGDIEKVYYFLGIYVDMANVVIIDSAPSGSTNQATPPSTALPTATSMFFGDDFRVILIWEPTYLAVASQQMAANPEKLKENARNLCSTATFCRVKIWPDTPKIVESLYYSPRGTAMDPGLEDCQFALYFKNQDTNVASFSFFEISPTCWVQPEK